MSHQKFPASFIIVFKDTMTMMDFLMSAPPEFSKKSHSFFHHGFSAWLTMAAEVFRGPGRKTALRVPDHCHVLAGSAQREMGRRAEA